MENRCIGRDNSTYCRRPDEDRQRNQPVGLALRSGRDDQRLPGDETKRGQREKSSSGAPHRPWRLSTGCVTYCRANPSCGADDERRLAGLHLRDPMDRLVGRHVV